MEYILNEDTLDRFYAFGTNVFGLSGDKEIVAKQAIAKVREFINELGLPTTLREVNIDETHFEEMATKACYANGNLYGFKHLNIEDVVNIYKKSL